MSKESSFENSMVSVLPPFENGQNSTLSSPFSSQIVIRDSTDSTPSSLSYESKKRKNPPNDKDSFTPECLLNIRNPTSTDKFKICNESTHGTLSSKMLPVDLTSIDQGFSRFWNTSVQQLSEKLWLCTGTDSVVSDSNSWNGSLRRLTRNSWFTVTCRNAKPKDLTITSENFQKILFPSSQCLWQGITANVAQKIENAVNAKKKKRKFNPSDNVPTSREVKPNLQRQHDQDAVKAQLLQNQYGRQGQRVLATTKTRPTVQEKKKIPADLSATRIRLYPSEQQRSVLTEWFNTNRWIYNRCVELQRKFTGTTLSISDLRRTFINEGCHRGKSTEWVLNTPTEVRTEAARDFQKALHSNMAKRRKQTADGKTHKFDMHFKSAKADSDSLVISAKVSGKSKELTLLRSMDSERGVLTDLQVLRDTRLTRKKNGFFYLNILKPISRVSESQAPLLTSVLDGVVAIDPGVRTFATCVDANNNTFEWAPGDVQKLCRLQHHSDRLKARISSHDHAIRHKQRNNMRRALARLSLRISNLVDDMHRKLCKWLCENFRVIFLPKFEIKGMAAKGQGRKISRRTVRGLYAWKHYTFRQRLISKAREYPWVQVYLVNEAFTSKTCTFCGVVHSNLGGQKVFHCPSCGRSISRDVGGARNILLRQLKLALLC